MNLLKKLVPLLVVLLAACGVQTGDQEDDGQLNIVTTFYPVYHFTNQVVGENGHVTVLLGAGQDTHNYEPTPKDMAAISEADVFVYSSEYMETWVPAVLETLKESDVKIIEAAEDLTFYEAESDDEEEHTEDDGHNHAVDPHVWLDPLYAKQMVETISSVIQTVDQENREVYQEQTATFVQELETLDEEYQAAFEAAHNRTFVTQHAAFGYLVRRYNLEEIAISSLTSNQEASPAKLAEITKYIQDNNVEVIYYQNTGNASLAEAVANETGIEKEILSAIEGVTDEEQTSGIDYLSIMRDNLQALKKTIK